MKKTNITTINAIEEDKVMNDVIVTNRIYNMDCLEGVRKMPDNSVDLIVSDPPYNFLTKNGKGTGVVKDSQYLKEIEYMQHHIGELYKGVVSGVTSNYVFVELENTVEGAVSIAYMYDDCYYFHEDLYAVIGEQSGKKYQLGDKVTIKVLRCDKIKKTIDFSFVDDNIEGVE